jgi:hypothetical protein
VSAKSIVDNFREYYADAENINKLDYDINISNYVAGGVVAIDLKTRAVKWELRTLIIVAC